MGALLKTACRYIPADGPFIEPRIGDTAFAPAHGVEQCLHHGERRLNDRLMWNWKSREVAEIAQGAADSIRDAMAAAVR